ncbi:MAG: hypothetical protein ACQESF_01670 [Nanobdellota archaeon]
MSLQITTNENLISFGVLDDLESITVPGKALYVTYLDIENGGYKLGKINSKCENRQELFLAPCVFALYHTATKICPYIEKQAEERDIKVFNDIYNTIDQLVDNYSKLLI